MNWLVKNKLLIGILILTLVGFSTYKYVYKPHKVIEELTTEFTGNSLVFITKVKEDFNLWNTKIVELEGEITFIGAKGITLNNQIYCQFKKMNQLSLIKEKQTIKIKGRVIGYDDLLDELKLEQCIII